MTLNTNGEPTMTEATTTRLTDRLVTNRLAPVALILAVLVPPAGAVLGHITLRQIGHTREGGRGVALAATIIGWSATIAWFVLWATVLTGPGAIALLSGIAA
jgi:hypothetical protein